MNKEETEKLRMNLVAIQKVDPYAKEILDSSPHVAYYNFRDTEWEKTEIEGNAKLLEIANYTNLSWSLCFPGSFFVYSRVAEPFHSIFINNRLNTNSLVEPIINLELQEQPPFLLYRNQRSAISGFWFYSMDDCVRIHKLIEKLIKKNATGKPADGRNNNHHHQVAKQQTPLQQLFKNGNGSKQPAGNGNDVDIFSMLRKAQEVSLKGEDAKKTTMGGPPPGVPQITRNFANLQMSHPPHPQQLHHPVLVKQISNTMPDITSPNVVNFFAAAQQPNGGPLKPEQIVQSQGKQFITNHPKVPPVQTLDEIEKQHRVSASPPQKIGKDSDIHQKGINNIFWTFFSTTTTLDFSAATDEDPAASCFPASRAQQADAYHSGNVPDFECC